MDEAERCGRVGYLYLSRLLALGTPGELKRLPAVTPPGTTRLEVLGIEPAATLDRLKRHPAVREATIFGQSVHALVDATATSAALGLAPDRVRAIEPNLEDVFVTLSKAQQAA
jgi:ABC-2 type transport system ATP-binding protein